MKRLTALAAMALTLSFAACDDDDDNGLGPEDLASIRIVNASATTQNLDVFAGNTSLATNIAFGSGTATCVTVPTGSQSLSLRAAGSSQAIATIDQDLADANYTLILFGQDDAELLTDQFTAPGTDLAQVRFINAASTIGAVDVHATAPGSDAFDAQPTAANLAVSTGSQFIEIPAGNNRIRFTAAGTQNVLFEIPTLTLPADRVSTVVLTENDASQLGFVSVEPCDD